MHEAERRLGLADTLARTASGTGANRRWWSPRCRRCCASACSRSRAVKGTPPTATSCAYRSPDQAGRRPGTGERPRPVLAAHHEPGWRTRPRARIEAARMTVALVNLFCRSFAAPPAAIILDIDDTCDPVHGRQQLSPFHAHYDTCCFLPVHVYHVDSGKPVAVRFPTGWRSSPTATGWSGSCQARDSHPLSGDDLARRTKNAGPNGQASVGATLDRGGAQVNTSIHVKDRQRCARVRGSWIESAYHLLTGKYGPEQRWHEPWNCISDNVILSVFYDK